MRRSANFKVLIVSVTLALFFVVVGANVFLVSVFGYHFNSKTNLKPIIQNINEVENDLIAKRGTIMDRGGTILAQDVTSYTLNANLDTERNNPDGSPAHVADKEDAAKKIAAIINMDYEKVLGILNQEAVQVEFGNAGKYLTLAQKNDLIDAEIPGLGFTEIISRNYPLSPFAPNILGFSSFDEIDGFQKGQLGIEKLYDEELQGINGNEKYQQDLSGYILKQADNYRQEPVDGKNIRLTLDRGIQETLENAMEGMSKDQDVKAKEVWGAVVEVKTGKILGWAEYPFFDANDPDTNWNSRGVEYAYEPGSTMKTFTIAAAIDQGIYNGEDTFDSGPFYVGLNEGKIVRLSNPENAIHTITNAGNADYGMMTYDRGYSLSSNVMIAEMLSNQLDVEIFHNYLLELGFFKPVNMDRIYDVSGFDLQAGPLEKLTNGFGQGSTVTMLQMVQAYTAILGNGTVVKPYIVDEIIDPNINEVVYKGQVSYGNKAFKESTAQSVRKNMRDVVESGSAMRFDVDDVTMIGKTGTAQYVSPDAPGYSPTEYIFSSIVAFPYEDPEVMIYTAYRANYGHSIDQQAEYVKDVIKKVVTTFDFSTDDDSGYINQATVETVKNFVNIGVDEAYEAIKSLGYRPIIIGDGSRVIKQYPVGNTKMISNEPVLLYTGSTGIVMPDMSGWSYKEVKNYALMSGINITINGHGFVTSQSIASGEGISSDSGISVELD